MDSPSLSPKVVTNPAEAGVGSSGQNPGSSAECSNSAEMTGRAVDLAPDTPNQLHPSRKRFQKFRSLCKRKATGFKDSARKLWTKTRKSASGSQYQKESPGRRVSTTSRQAAVSSFPNDERNHSSVTTTDSATVAPATLQAVQPDATVTRVNQTSIMDSGENILAINNTETRASDSAVISAAMESIGGEAPIHGSAGAIPSSPITGALPSSTTTEEKYVNGNPVNSRPAIAVGKDDMTDQTPDNRTSGNESLKKRGTSPWQSFKNIMSVVGRFISGLIGKLISLFRRTENSKNDSPSGSNPASSSPVSTMDTGDRIQIPVQGNASLQEYARPGKEKTGKTEVDPDRIDLSARPSLDSYDYSARQEHGSDKSRKMSQPAGVVPSGSPDPVTVMPENSSGNGSNNAPRAPLETADKEKTEQAHSGGSGNPGFQGGAMVDHPIQPDRQQGEDCKSDDTNLQTCPDKQSLAMHDSPDSEKTPDPTGGKIADVPGASPNHLANSPSVRENEDTGQEDSGIKTVPARLRDCKNQVEINQFIRHQGEEHASLLAAAISEAKVFFTDLITLVKYLNQLEELKLTEKKKIANKHIKPIILRMNQTGKTLQECCNTLFKLLNVTNNSRKNAIMHTLLDSAFDPQIKRNGQKEEGLNPDLQTLMFFNSCLQDYMKDRSLDQYQNVDITITIKDVLGGGGVGAIASFFLSGFPSWRLTLDCTYRTLLSVIAGQAIKWEARHRMS